MAARCAEHNGFLLLLQMKRHLFIAQKQNNSESCNGVQRGQSVINTAAAEVETLVLLLCDFSVLLDNDIKTE